MHALDVILRTLAIPELEVAIELRAAMNQEMNSTDPDQEYPGWRERFRSFFAPRLSADTGAIYVAEQFGKTLGLASVYKVVNHRTEIFLLPVAYITSVYVIPEQRRQRLGTRLTQACVDWARQRGCDVIRLRASPMGLPVYLHMGFTPSNELELRFDRD